MTVSIDIKTHATAPLLLVAVNVSAAQVISPPNMTVPISCVLPLYAKLNRMAAILRSRAATRFIK